MQINICMALIFDTIKARSSEVKFINTLLLLGVRVNVLYKILGFKKSTGRTETLITNPYSRSQIVAHSNLL